MSAGKMLGLKQSACEHQRKTEGLKQNNCSDQIRPVGVLQARLAPPPLIQAAQLLAEGEEQRHQT